MIPIFSGVACNGVANTVVKSARVCRFSGLVATENTTE